jgi:tricorn protease
MFGSKTAYQKKMNNRQITFDKEMTKGAYLRGRNEIYTIDLNTFKNALVLKYELCRFNNSNLPFPLDVKYFVYDTYRGLEADIFVCDIASKKSMNITNTKVSKFEAT